jgi:hypothetical protein
MSKIYNWDNKRVEKISLPLDILNKYCLNKDYFITDIKNTFKKSYYDFKNEILRIDYFSEIANRLWWILVEQKNEKSELGDITLLASEINFYLESNNLDKVDDILYDIEKYLENKEK